MAPPLKAHCKWGHEFTPENVVFDKLKSGYTVRKCRECRRLYDKERYRDKPAYRELAKLRAYQRYHGVAAAGNYSDQDDARTNPNPI